MIVEYHRHFRKDLAKRPERIRERLFERQRLWSTDPRDPLLDDHALSGELVGLRSFSVSGNLRVVYQLEAKDRALFLRFGTHSELYGS